MCSLFFKNNFLRIERACLALKISYYPLCSLTSEIIFLLTNILASIVTEEDTIIEAFMLFLLHFNIVAFTTGVWA